MRDELVKDLRICAEGEHCDKCGKWEVKQNGGRNACEYAICTEAANVIEELTAIREEQKAQIIVMAAEIEEQQPRWIPVTERKPKTDDLVIVAIHDDSSDTSYDVTNVGFYLDVFPLGIWVVENERCNYVTHWMPLPQPPKEEP